MPAALRLGGQSVECQIDCETANCIETGYLRTAMGMHATAVDDPEQRGRAWDAALTAEQPTLLDVRTDLEVPPIPPHVTYDQMKSTAEAIIKGDLFAEIAKNNAAELLPH